MLHFLRWETFQTSTVTQDNWFCCHSIGHIWFHVRLPL